MGAPEPDSEKVPKQKTKKPAEEDDSEEKGPKEKTKKPAEEDDSESGKPTKPKKEKPGAEDTVQLASDPCIGNCGNWKLPTEKENFKKDYTVNDFGPDPDMVGTMNSLRVA
jgi:hypothetical protein